MPFFQQQGRGRPHHDHARHALGRAAPRVRHPFSPAWNQFARAARGSDQAAEQRRRSKAVLASLVEPYQQAYQDQVFDCLKQQGGLEQCSLAFYADRDLGDDGQWDNWRLEGPSLVWFFRGSPHAHIWIHVAGDPSAPMTSYFG